MNTVFVAPDPIVIDTGIPVQKGLVGVKTLDKAKDAFDAVIVQLTAFLQDSAQQAMAGLDADSVTLGCSLSITAGVTWAVELSATGDFSLSATWEK